MSFDVSADAYLRFMGRYSGPLAEQFVDLLGVAAGMTVLDVGCGPGVVTGVLAQRCGAASVAAVDPSEPFVEAVGDRLPGVDVRHASAEALPFDDGTFDTTLAQLVVHFMTDPVAGLREMGRVTRTGGTVAASVWDFGGGTAPLSTFWQATRQLDPDAPGEADRPGAREGELARLADAAGLTAVRSTRLTVHLPFTSFAQWWAPYLDGVGPVGDYLATLDPTQLQRLERRCRELLPAPPFDHAAGAWVVLAEAP